MRFRRSLLLGLVALTICCPAAGRQPLRAPVRPLTPGRHLQACSISLHFENKCAAGIMLAVRAKLSDNDGLTADYCNNGIISKDGWCTRAWFELAAGEDKYVLDTGNRYIYFYAYTTDSEIVWRGHGDEPWCDTSSGEPCTSISLSSTCQQFREKNIGEDCVDTYTISLTCKDDGGAGPGPSGDLCSSAIVKEDFYVDGASLCSLATIGSPLHSTKASTSAECCAACAAYSSSPSCNVFNFCNAATGSSCFMPGMSSSGIASGDCHFYHVDSATQFQARLGSATGCGSIRGWLVGYLQPSVGGGSCPSSAKKQEKAIFNQRGSLCSLITTGSPLDVKYGIASAEQCCAACAADGKCNAYNFCVGNGDTCFLPGLSKANTGDCFFYQTDESTWVQQVSTCGGGDFTTGFLG